MTSFHLISLGCAKNLVDSEIVLGGLTASGLHFVADPEQADVLLLNTCGFLQSAVEEAIEEILDLTRIQQQTSCLVVVFGCLVERYREKLAAELPEVDLFLGANAPALVAGAVQQLLAGQRQKRVIIHAPSLSTSAQPRLLATPGHRAYMKITEGCDNRCTYCLLPQIRGPLRSRAIADLLAEAQSLEEMGVREVSLIAQDLTAYGRDWGGQDELVSLLQALLGNTGIAWWRLLYLYPTAVSDALLACIRENSRITPYLDIPFQHASDRILRAMNRRYGRDDLYRLVERIRAAVPDVSLRSTMLIGFPGEEESDVRQVETLLADLHLDHVGVFAYSNEEGAPSEKLPGQCGEEEKNERVERILARQADISAAIQQRYINQELEVLVEGLSRESDLLLEGRSRYQAPEVDGCVLINEGFASAGDIVRVKIAEAQTYDLLGGIVDTAE